MKEKMTVDVVVVNWNSGAQLRDCIASVRAHPAGLVGKCIVVDNGSTDGSTDFLAGAEDVDLVLTGENLGFGWACNVGAARGDNPFILLLNPDACLMKGSLSVPTAFFQRPENAGIGIVGVQLLDGDGSVQRSCARFPQPWRLVAKSVGLSALIKQVDFHMLDWDHAETRRVDQVIGAFFFVRRSLFAQLNGMDERFFVYFEEVDFSRRAAQAGYGTVYLTEAQAFHRGGGVSEQVKAHRLFYSLRSRIQYAFKHFSGPAALAVAASTLLVEPMSRLGFLILLRRWAEIGDLGRGYRMLWTWVLARMMGWAD